MAGQSAFDRQQIQQDSHSEGSGLLEHLNLPPVVIRFIKKNKRKLQIGVVAVLTVVTCSILYDSYRSNRIQKASAALAVAMQTAEPERHNALVGVAADFSGTPSAHWARVELAHEQMKEGKFKEAAEQYGAVRKKISTSDPLFALLTFGLAQANESAGLVEAANLEYKALQKIEGYEGEGFTGLARIYESQGEMKQARDVYEEYLLTLSDQGQNDPVKAKVEEKIARLKAMQ
ncbi:MAG: tetratricopeptide repeat protein [Desulfobulbaceae bacterium]